MTPILLTHAPAVWTLSFNDPERRNALSLAMFDALDDALTRLMEQNDVRVLIVRGEGAAFCAGFDLAACVHNPPLLGEFIRRLSRVTRALRRLPQVVVACVHGAAIAGGCAIVSACDFVVVEHDAVLGYPVHPLGISPAVTIPTLRQTLGDGRARSLLMSGALISGVQAHHLGLASHLAATPGGASETAGDLARGLLAKSTHALRAAKAWIGEIDGSMRDEPFDQPCENSAANTESEQTRRMLSAFWNARKG